MTLIDQAIKTLDTHGIEWRFNGHSPGVDDNTLEYVELLDVGVNVAGVTSKWVPCPPTIKDLFRWLQY